MLASLKQAKTEKEALVHLIEWLECADDGVIQANEESFVADEISRATSMETKGERNQVTYFSFHFKLSDSSPTQPLFFQH